MAKKKHREVGPFTVREGKDPGDPDSERGWRVYDGYEPYDADEVYDDEDEAAQRATELWCEQLAGEVAEAAENCSDPKLLNLVRKMLTGEVEEGSPVYD